MRRRISFNRNLNKIVIMIGLFTLTSACGREKIESQKTTTPIIVNGISDDWKNYNQVLYKDWSAVYSVINDDTSLSLLFQFRDPQLARKINMRGLTLWINSEGDKEKVTGIHYENRKFMDAMLDNMAEGKRMLREKPDENFEGPGRDEHEKFAGTFSLRDNEGYVISNNGKNGIYGGANKKDGNYCFEFTIKPSAENGLIISPDTDLKLGIEIAAVNEEVKEMMEKRKPGGMDGKIEPPEDGMSGGGMRGGGRSGGGMGGPPPDGKRGNMQNDTDAQEIWFSVTLAK